MAEEYAIEYDAVRAILTIRAQGFWSKETQNAFGDALIVKLHALRDAGHRFTVLADASCFPVQSMAVSMGFMGIVHRIGPDLRLPTAIVATGALLRLQALRVLVAPHIRIFPAQEPALAWLAEASEKAAART